MAARIAHFFRRDGPDASASAQGGSTAADSRYGEDEGVPGEHAGESVYEEINPNPDIWPVIPSTSSFSLNIDQIGQSSIAPRSRKASARSHSQQDSISSHADPFNPPVPGTVGVSTTEVIDSLFPTSAAENDGAHQEVGNGEDNTLSSVIPSLATSSDPSAGGDWTLSLGLPPPSPPPGHRKTSRPSLPTLLSPLIKSNTQSQRLSATTVQGGHESSSNSDPQPLASLSPGLPHALEAQVPVTSVQATTERPSTGELDELNAAHRHAHEAYREQQGDNYTALARKELVKEARDQKEKQRALAQARLANPAIANGPPPIPEDDGNRKKKRFKRWSSSAYTTSSDGGHHSPYRAIPGPSTKQSRVHSTGVGAFSLSPPPWKITPGMRRKAAREKARKTAAEQQAVEAARAEAAAEAASEVGISRGAVAPDATYGSEQGPTASQNRRSMGAITYNRVATNVNEDWVDELSPAEMEGRAGHGRSGSESASASGFASESEAARRTRSRLAAASPDDSTSMSGSGYATGSSARRRRRDKRRRERQDVSDTWEYQVAESLYLAGILAQRSGNNSDAVASGRSDAASGSHAGTHDPPATPSRLSTLSAHLTPPLFRRRSDQPSESRSRSKLSLGAVSRGSPTPDQLRRASTRATPEPLAHVIEVEHVDALDRELNEEDSDSDWYDAADDVEPVTGLVDSPSDGTPVATPKQVDLDVDIATMIAKGHLPRGFDPSPVAVRLSTASSISYSANRRGSHNKRGSLVSAAKENRLSIVSMRPKLDGRQSVLFVNGIEEENPFNGQSVYDGDGVDEGDYAQVLALGDDEDGGSTTPRAISPQPPQAPTGKSILEAHKGTPMLTNRGEILMLPMPPLPVRSRLPYLPSADANFLPHSPSTLRKMWRKELKQRKRLADAERRRQEKIMRVQRKEALRLQREEQDAERGRRSTAERQGNIIGLGITSVDGLESNAVEGLAATDLRQTDAGPSSPPLSLDRQSPFSRAESSMAPARWEAQTNLSPPEMSETFLPRDMVGPQIRTSIPNWRSAWSVSSHGEQSSFQTSDSGSVHNTSSRGLHRSCFRLPQFLLPLTLVPPNAWCFVFGFVLPPLWWIGAFWPVHNFTGRSERWGGFRRSKLLRRQFQSRSTVITSSQLRNIDTRRAEEEKNGRRVAVASATGANSHPMANWSHVRRTSGPRVSWIGDFLAEHPHPTRDRNESEEAQTFWAFQRSIHMWRLRCRIMSIVSVFLVTLLVVGGVLAGTLR